MFTYHYDTFIKVYRLYHRGGFMASFKDEKILLSLFPKALRV